MAKKDSKTKKQVGIAGKLKAAARAVAVEVFGNGKRSGFVSSIEAAKQSGERGQTASGRTGRIVDEPYVGKLGAANMNELRSEKDGRLFAIELLKKIEAECNRAPLYSDIFTMEADAEAPQSPIVREAFDTIYSASEAARRGFFVIITERLGMARDGYFHVEAVEELEREGKIRQAVDRGEPEAASDNPAAEANAAALKSLDGWAGEIYALDDMARRFPQSPLSLTTTRTAALAIMDSLQAMLEGASSVLPEEHAAQGAITYAFASVAEYCERLLEVDDGEGNVIHASLRTKKEIAAELLALVVRAGQAIERAELACGAATVTAGYLHHEGKTDPCRELKPKKVK